MEEMIDNFDAVEAVEDIETVDEAVEGSVVDSVEDVVAEVVEETVEAVESSEESGETIDVKVELESLRGELLSLRDELRHRDEIYDRASAEYSDFARLYPEVSFSDIPKDVWKMAKEGVPLAAAYAYSEVMRRKREAEIAEADRISREASAGALSGGVVDYYSPDEVRRMSPEEVRANYKKITESMKKWR